MLSLTNLSIARGLPQSIYHRLNDAVRGNPVLRAAARIVKPNRTVRVKAPGVEGTLKIAFFVRALNEGEALRDSILLANEIATRGHAVELLTLVPEGTLRMLVSERVSVVPVAGGKLRTAAWDLHRALIERQPDVLVSAEAAPNLVALLAARLVPEEIRPRIVLRELGTPSIALDRDPAWQNRIAYRVLRFVYRFADVVVALTEGAVADLRDHCGVPEERVARMWASPVILNAPADSSEPREKNLIVAVGRMVPEKGHAALIRAFAKAAQPGWRLAIVGDGWMRERLDGLARKLGVRARIVLTGSVSDPLFVFRRATLAVSSSRYEGFGRSIVQALACGTPVVATDCPYGPREILADGRFGTLVPVGDINALADALTQAMAQQAVDRDALRARAAMHTVARAADALLGIIDGVASTGSVQGLPDFGGRGRHVDMTDAPMVQRIHNRVD
jgi:glycosyltransferase involved in cell wall biosynthesis